MGENMKKIIFVFFIFIISIWPQEDSKVLKSFQKIIITYKTFFSEPHFYCTRQIMTTPYEGELRENNSIMLYSPNKINYDAQKTESLLSPYYGFIEIEYKL